jgi:hypothetical protein
MKHLFLPRRIRLDLPFLDRPSGVVFLILFLAVLLLNGGSAFGQYDLSWNTVDGGGGTSTGGAYTVSGTIGQTDAGVMAGGGPGGFELSGGFWPGLGEGGAPTCGPDIAPPPSGDGLVNIDDLLAVITAWGPCPPPCDADIAPAGVGDGNVNIDDLLMVITAWGSCP